jgi:hypothetical protein
MSPRIAALFVWSAAAALCPLASAQRVWVVSPVNSSGVNFTDVQPSVDAAADGDTILVRAGTYSGFRIDGKGVAVHADGPGVAVAPDESIRIANIGAGQQVVLRGFSQLAGPGLSIESCAGPVLVEECVFMANEAQGASHGGASVVNSPRVTIAHSLLLGTTPFSTSPPVAGAGLSAVASGVTLHGCVLGGGNGASLGLAFANGGPGAALDGSAIVADNTWIVGGTGGAGIGLLGSCLSPPTEGGPAISFPGQPSNLYAFAATIVPGNGGTGALCPPARAGKKVVGTGIVTEIEGVAASVLTPDPVRSGQTVNVDVTGPVGASGFLLVSAVADPVFLQGCHGTIGPAAAYALTVPVGVMPGSGQISLPMTVVAPLGVPGATVYLQTVMLQGNSCFLGATTAMLLLDSGF